MNETERIARRRLTRRTLLQAGVAAAAGSLATGFPVPRGRRAAAASPFVLTFASRVPNDVRATAAEAVKAWEPHITTPVPIRISIDWGGDRTQVSVPTYDNFPGQPLPGHAYPKALVNRLTGRDANPSLPDLTVTFTDTNAETATDKFPSRFPWQIGTGLPGRSDARDFFTVMLAMVRIALAGPTGLVGSTRDKVLLPAKPGITDSLIADPSGTPLTTLAEGQADIGPVMRAKPVYRGASAASLAGGAPVPMSLLGSYWTPDLFSCSLPSAMDARLDGTNSMVLRAPTVFDVALARDIGWGSSPLVSAQGVQPRSAALFASSGVQSERSEARGSWCGETRHVAAATLDADELHFATMNRDLSTLGPAHFTITFTSDVPTNARASITAGINLWATHLTSDVPIQVEAHWGDAGAGVAAFATSIDIVRPPSGLPTGAIFPAAVANRLLGRKLAPGPDMIITFGKDTAWYLGLDGERAPWQSTLMTTAAHEAGHGLGFATRMVRNGVTGNGALSEYTGPGIPDWGKSIDPFLRDASGKALLSLIASPAPFGVAIASAPHFHGERALAANGGTPPRLVLGRGAHLMPPTFDQVCGGGDFPLMATTSSPLHASRRGIIDAVTVGVMEDLGWGPNGASAFAQAPLNLPRRAALPSLARD